MKTVTSKKGASIFEAAFCLVESIQIYAVGLNWKDKSVFFAHGDSEFGNIIALMESADEITVIESDGSAIMILPDGSVKSNVQAFAKSYIGKTGLFKNVFVFTKSIDEIRALAKEIRSDKSVARAAKVPEKPKADLKTRRDII